MGTVNFFGFTSQMVRELCCWFFKSA